MISILKKITPSFIDYPDNDSLCLCVCVMGCDHNCTGCQNPQFKDHELSNEFIERHSVQSLYEKISILAERNKTNKIVFTGGDPLSSKNINFISEFIKFKQFDFCIYTGHTIDYVIKNNVTGFKYIKCGTFNHLDKRPPKKDDDKMIFASSNQNLYDENYNLISENGIFYFN